ncbi:MAG: RNA polymerase sigma factor [Leptospirales bacterium]|nr:RNA polymerase sigma factor [Leptospirales bacterium]
MESRQKESDLIRRAARGDEKAFIELISPYQVRLLRRAHALLGSLEDAEDALQESLIMAYRSLANFRGESGIYTYVYRIVINKCHDSVRKRKRTESESLDNIPLISDERVSISKNHELSEESSYLILQINKLDKKYRQVLLMRYYDALSYQEIADLIHISVGTVKSRLFKARELLKRSIVRDGKGEEYFADMV